MTDDQGPMMLSANLLTLVLAIDYEQAGNKEGTFIPAPEFCRLHQVVESIGFPVFISKINKALDRFTEEDLDHVILPHPILGKLTVREMMYFTMLHVEHHRVKTIQNLVKAQREA